MCTKAKYSKHTYVYTVHPSNGTYMFTLEGCIYEIQWSGTGGSTVHAYVHKEMYTVTPNSPLPHKLAPWGQNRRLNLVPLELF